MRAVVLLLETFRRSGLTSSDLWKNRLVKQNQAVYFGTGQWAVMLGGWEVTAGLAESNDNLLPGLWLWSPAGWLTTEDRDQLQNPTLLSSMELLLPYL